MKTIRHLFTVLMLLCSAVAFAHDFEVGGIYYNILSEADKTVEVTFKGSSYSEYSNEYTGSVVIPETVTKSEFITTVIETFDDWISTNKGNDDTTSQTSYTLNVKAGEILKFDWSVNSESNYDWLIITLDGTEIVKKSGTLSGSYEMAFDTSGAHTLVVKYTKDSYANRGDDEGKIYNITLNTAIGTNDVVYSVTSIGEDAFRDCSGLTSIVIPNSVTGIGSYAFEYCTGLTSVTIPNSVTSIGESAFYNCTGLTNIEIPNSVTSIEDGTFSNCTGLTSVEISNSVTFIGGWAFYNCSGLTSVVIPNSVTFIGMWAFSGCTGLTSVEIGNSVTSIGDEAFIRCTGLTSIVVDGNNTKYDSRENCNAIIETETNTLILGCKNTVILNSVASIGDRAFSDCTGLTSIEIPNSVTFIGDNAFSYCSGLTSIVIGNSVTSIGIYAFYGCSGLTSIVVDGNNTKYDSRENCNAIIETETNTLILGCKNTVIPNSVTSIGNWAFYGCTGLTSIVIGNSVTSIGNSAFRGCSGLTSIEIPNSVTNIGNDAFYRCSGLTSVVIGNSVTSIERYAFSWCTGLTSIEIPNSVTSIGECAFEYCRGLNEVHISDLSAWCNINFSSGKANPLCYAKNLYLNGELVTELLIPDDVTSIGSYAFYECSGLTNVEIPNGVTSIGSCAFYNCTGLTSITSLIPADALFTVDSYTFYNVDKNTCTLYVPYGAKETYASTEGWSEFKNIVEMRKYMATFCIDGEVIAVYDIKEGDVIVFPDVNEREGYTLVWTTDVDVMPSENIVIEGTFVVNNYTVTYTVDGEIYATDSIAYGNEIVLRDEPAKLGYTFSGWSEAPETMPANDIVIEGTFIANTYTVTYTVDGEIYATDSIVYGNEIVLRDEPVKEGYTFSGWSEVSETMPANDIVIEGIFSVNTYTVTYTVDGEIYATDSIVYGNEIVLRDEPVKLGYTFSGWSEAPKTMPANDIVIEGTFSVNSSTITFVVDGEVYKSMDVEYGAEIPTVEQPVKDGRKFSGWSEIPSTMPAEDITIEGKFCYTVIFMSDGKYYSSSEVYYGSEIEVPSGMPHKEGHTFVDWSDYPDAMPARDITILATFSVNKYQLIFIIDSEVYETLYIEYGSKIEYPQKDGYIITWEVENLPQTMPAENLIIIGTSALDTAVECVKDDNEKIVYTLDGHRILDVENLEKGVYIINGKKVLVK